MITKISFSGANVRFLFSCLKVIFKNVCLTHKHLVRKSICENNLDHAPTQTQGVGGLGGRVKSSVGNKKYVPLIPLNL